VVETLVTIVKVAHIWHTLTHSLDYYKRLWHRRRWKCRHTQFPIDRCGRLPDVLGIVMDRSPTSLSAAMQALD